MLRRAERALAEQVAGIDSVNSDTHGDSQS